MAVTDFDTKLAVVVRDDLAMWQKLNVTAFLTSGVVSGAGAGVVGEPYEDAMTADAPGGPVTTTVTRRVKPGHDAIAVPLMTWGRDAARDAAAASLAVPARPMTAVCGRA